MAPVESATKRPDGAGARRLALLAFGGFLVALFIGFAVAQGIGAPSVPSGDVALVQGVPDDLATVSEVEFDRTMKQQAAQAELKNSPKPGNKKYEELKTAAMGELLDGVWIRGAAEELGVKVTDEEVAKQLAQVRKQSFPTKSSFEKFLKESKFTREDVTDRLELQLLSNAVQEQVNSEAPSPSSSDVKSYYETEKETQFTAQESRDVLIVINEDKSKVQAAKRALEKGHSAADWKKAATKYSSDPTSKAKGGLQEGITEEFLEEPLKKTIFGASTDELIGPVEYSGNYLLLEVAKVNRAGVKPFSEVSAQIASTLTQQRQQEHFDEFVSNYETDWKLRTTCAEGFVTERCANYEGTGHPNGALEACYEANPKGGLPREGCPAPVEQTKPALPGSVTPLSPRGEQMAQRPIPESVAKATQESREHVASEGVSAGGE